MLLCRSALACRSLSSCVRATMSVPPGTSISYNRSPVPSTSSPLGTPSPLSPRTEVLVIESSEDERDTIIAAHKTIAKKDSSTAISRYGRAICDGGGGDEVDQGTNNDNNSLDVAASFVYPEEKGTKQTTATVTETDTENEPTSIVNNDKSPISTTIVPPSNTSPSPQNTHKFAKSLSRFRFNDNTNLSRSLSASSSGSMSQIRPSHGTVRGLGHSQSALSEDSSSSELPQSHNKNQHTSLTNCLPENIVEVLKSCPVCQLKWTVKKGTKTKRTHIISCFKKSQHVNTTITTATKTNEKEIFLNNLVERTIRQQVREQRKVDDASISSSTRTNSETLMGMTLASRSSTVCAVGVDDPTGSTSTADLQKHIDDRKRIEKSKNQKARRIDTSKQQQEQDQSISRYLSETPSAESVKLAKIIAEFDAQRKKSGSSESEDILGISSASYMSCSPRRKRSSAAIMIPDEYVIENENNQTEEVEEELEFPSTQVLPTSRFASNTQQQANDNDTLSNSNAVNSDHSSIHNIQNGILEHFPSSNHLLNRPTSSSSLSSSNISRSLSVTSNISSGGLWNIAGNSSVVRQTSARRYSCSSSASSRKSSHSISTGVIIDDHNNEYSSHQDSSATKKSKQTKLTMKVKVSPTKARSTIVSRKRTTSNKSSMRKKTEEGDERSNENIIDHGKNSSHRKPNYEDWTIAQLQDEVDKFGYKKSRARDVMIGQLNKVWDALLNIEMEHLIIEGLSDDMEVKNRQQQPETISKKKISSARKVALNEWKTTKATSRVKKTGTKGKRSSSPSSLTKKKSIQVENVVTDCADDDDTGEEEEPEVDINVKNKATEQLLKAILSNTELHLRILRYEPIPFETFEEFAKNNSIKISKVALRQFLDTECVTYYTESVGRRR